MSNNRESQEYVMKKQVNDGSHKTAVYYGEPE
jgi:hypothetical protein